MAADQRQSLPKDSGWYLVFAFVGTFAVLVSFKWDVRLMLRWGIYSLLALALLTFILNSLGPRVLSWWYQIFPKSQPEDAGLPEEEVSSQRQDQIERVEDDYKQKATKYNEEILKPREEAKREQEEKEFYNFAGPAWKGKGQRLGEPGDDVSEGTKVTRRQRTTGTGKEAVSVRKLPESATRSPPPQPEQKEKPKRVIILPDEPDEGTPQSITVAMRGVTGKVNKRRFLCADLVKSVIDWMTKQGYHPQLYTLCTTYPKQDLYQHALHTLEEVGMNKDTLLVVEERDDRLPEEEMIEW